MPAYHSQFNDADVDQACGFAILALKTRMPGPAPKIKSGEEDIVDEAIKLFRANVLFATFDVSGPADRTLMYLTLLISQTLVRLQDCKSKKAAVQIMFDLAKESFPIPGDRSFPLAGMVFSPKNEREAETCRNYMKQLREETCQRMVNVIYANSETPNKFWMGFSKRKFMNIMVR